MFSKKRGVIFGIFILLIVVLSFVQVEGLIDDCIPSGGNYCSSPYSVQDGADCCLPTGSTCGSNSDCEDNNPCTSDSCLLEVDKDYFVCYNPNACPDYLNCVAEGDTYSCQFEGENHVSTLCSNTQYIGPDVFYDCEGSWTIPEVLASCSGSYSECVEDPSAPPPPPDGICHAGESLEYFSCFGLSQVNCNNQPTCTYTPSTPQQTYNCNVEYDTISECDGNSACTTIKTNTCLPKKDLCESCDYSGQCSSDNCMSNSIGEDSSCIESDISLNNLSESQCYSGICETCNSGNDCASGNCVEDQNGIGRCANLDQCLTFDSSTVTCTMYSLGDSYCSGDTEKMNCSSSGWSSTICGDGSFCVDGECITPPTPEAYWEDEDTQVNQSLKTIEIMPEQIPYNINLILKNSGLTSETFVIKEDDSGEGALNGDDSIKNLVSSTVSGNKLIATWSITQEDLDAAGTEEDGIYEFYFEVAGETSLNVFINPVFATPSCSDGEQNGFEEGIDCGGECEAACDDPALCSDGNLNGLETEIDCGGPYCPTCASASWTSPYSGIYMENITVDSDNVPKGITFRMVLSQPADTEDLQFALKESDAGEGTLNWDDNIETFMGTLNSAGDIEFNWTTTLENFEDAGNEEGNLYEFYFEIQGKRSNDLEIQLDDVLPSCSDGIQNGDEEGVDCEGSCPNECPPPVCNFINVCADYGEMGECNADECNVSETSVPGLGADETASCKWFETLSKCDTQTSVTFNGTNIGNCVYDEDTTTDNCDDGFLSYSWNVSWEWDGNNAWATKLLCENANSVGTCVLGIEGNYHYDPELANEDCVSGSQTIPCPAQIQLNFFTWKNFFATALLILIIYIILRSSKTVKKKVLGKGKKKTTKKSTKKKVVGKKIKGKKKAVKKKK